MSTSPTSAEFNELLARLEPLLADQGVWNIMIDGHQRVLAGRDDQLEPVKSPFTSQAELQTLIDGLFGQHGIKLDATNPIGHLRLADHSRVTAVMPPHAVDGPYLVLRRIVGPRLTWENLLSYGTVSEEGYQLLKSAVAARTNILVAGGSNSGKTTIASVMADLIPAEERFVIVEQDYEMLIEHPRAVRLEAGGPGGLTLESLLTAAERMRPDRLVVGELTGPVAAKVLQSFGSGLDGSLTSIHGTNVTDALNRLESFCLMANLGLGLQEIRHLIASGIQLIIYQKYLPEGSRKIVDIIELRGVENHHYILQPLMRYNQETKRSEFTEVQPSWVQASGKTASA